jgi:hypothetical protein
MKKVGIIYVDDKPIYMVNIKEIDDNSYIELKKQVDNNREAYFNNIKKENETLKDSVSKMAIILKEHIK